MKRGYTLIELLVVTAIIGIVFVVFLGVVSPSHEPALKALNGHGFKNANIWSRSFFSCGKDDLYGFSFSATNPANDTVNGVVCCGMWKGCTVRF